MEAQPEYRGAMFKASPPPYNEGFGPNGASKRQLGPAMGGHWYRETPQRETIRFLICPDPSQHPLTQDWVALLSVKCGDVPRLMREGFYWDVSNVVNEDGFINIDWKRGSNTSRPDGQKWYGTRSYFLEDLQSPQLWIALIEIMALYEETLYNFQLSQLSRENIQCAKAISQLGHYIYQYNYDRPQSCYNAIYPNTPMKGYWPWPRSEFE
ncbi:hypothetical protein GGR58DRAFT_126797 [Xylaria digitata]|nr:hypothetical protein GGR58DRAFT_126797 [Xylaria digitata]